MQSTEVGGFLWLIFLLVFLVTVAYAFAILFHWFRYGYMYPFVWIMLPVYIVGTLIFMGGALSVLALL